MAKQMKKENVDVAGEQFVMNDAGNPCYDDTSKKVAWKQHYERLLNEEFAWDEDSLTVHDPVKGPSICITPEKKMKCGKAAGPSGIVAEMLKAAGVQLVTSLSNSIVKYGSIPVDWEESFIINLYKGKGDALLRKNYHGLKLLEQVMKVIERVVENLIRDTVSI